jgi:predicted nucleic acid-binding protein
MSTTKKRINISLSNELEKTIEKLAKRDEVPEATKASDLLRLAVEIEEDAVWDSIAKSRDTKDAKFLSHKKAWA